VKIQPLLVLDAQLRGKVTHSFQILCFPRQVFLNYTQKRALGFIF